MFSGCPSSLHAAHPSGDRVILNQNTPNPFNTTTVISYFIPESVKQAQIRVYDDMGRLIRKFDIMSKGSGHITFYSEDPRKRLYSYSIFAEGKLIDTKKMMH
jgi:flagellar hook assembly protein FlgD